MALGDALPALRLACRSFIEFLNEVARRVCCRHASFSPAASGGRAARAGMYRRWERAARAQVASQRGRASAGEPGLNTIVLASACECGRKGGFGGEGARRLKWRHEGEGLITSSIRLLQGGWGAAIGLVRDWLNCNVDWSCALPHDGSHTLAPSACKVDACSTPRIAEAAKPYTRRHAIEHTQSLPSASALTAPQG